MGRKETGRKWKLAYCPVTTLHILNVLSLLLLQTLFESGDQHTPITRREARIHRKSGDECTNSKRENKKELEHYNK
jgi:hypothetical protein